MEVIKKDALIRILVVVLITIIGAYFSFEIDLLEERIPITGQSLAIMVGCFFLKPQEAIIAMLFYLFLGIIGLPVFAGGTSGFNKIIGATGGFLYGFVFSGFAISYLSNNGYRYTAIKTCIAMCIATVILLVLGNFHLSLKIGLEKALQNAFFPFWKAAVIKIFLGTGLIMIIEYFLSLEPVNKD